jgi:hypothetical protein
MEPIIIPARVPVERPLELCVDIGEENAVCDGVWVGVFVIVGVTLVAAELEASVLGAGAAPEMVTMAEFAVRNKGDVGVASGAIR